MVEAMARLAHRARVHHPADVATLEAVDAPKAVAQVPFGQLGQQAALGAIPSPQLLGVVVGERDHLALLGFEPRHVEVAAEDAMAVAGAGERVEDRLQRLHLDQPVRGRRRDVGVVQLELAGGRLDDDRDDALGVGRADRGQRSQRPPARGGAEQPPPAHQLRRFGEMRETHLRAGGAPALHGRGPDLLQADEVGLLALERGRLAVELDDPAGNVPGEQLHRGVGSPTLTGSYRVDR